MNDNWNDGKGSNPSYDSGGVPSDWKPSGRDLREIKIEELEDTIMKMQEYHHKAMEAVLELNYKLKNELMEAQRCTITNGEEQQC